jgi:hypothetical protein
MGPNSLKKIMMLKLGCQEIKKAKGGTFIIRAVDSNGVKRKAQDYDTTRDSPVKPKLQMLQH